MNWKAISSASHKFLVTRETANVLPDMESFGRMIGAAIDLYHVVDPDETKTFWRQVVYRLLRLALMKVGDSY